jgi:hypothetical protein
MFSTFQVFTDLKGEGFDLSGGLAPERSGKGYYYPLPVGILTTFYPVTFG